MTVALVTATPMKAKSGMVVSSPRAWPAIWSRWDLAYRVKSGILSESVAQYPTIAVTQGRNRVPNDLGPSLLPRRTSELASIGLMPPPFAAAHQSSARPITIRNGADSVSSHLIDSVPFQTNHRLMSQNAAKP